MTEENKTYSGLFEALSALQDAIEQPKKMQVIQCLNHHMSR
ncbi:hypothetical protein ACX9VS_07640 [Weissella paramesenteroides]